MGTVRRGDVVLAAAPGDYGKPRPWLVVQADMHIDNERPNSIIVCPFTRHEETLPYRVAVNLPYGHTTRLSWAMADKVMAVKRERIRAVVGKVLPGELRAVELAIADLRGFVFA